MLARQGAKTTYIATKFVQNPIQHRMLNISPLSCSDKTIIEQAKQGAQTIVEKAKDTVEAVKETVMGGTNIKGKEGDPRGTHRAVEQLINKNDEEFSKTDKKLGHSGNTHGRGGYDPKSN